MARSFSSPVDAFTALTRCQKTRHCKPRARTEQFFRFMQTSCMHASMHSSMSHDSCFMPEGILPERIHHAGSLHSCLPESCQTECILPDSCIHANQRKMLVTFANQKGGVGKTTLSVTYAIWLFDHGFRVGFLDADTQGLSSTWLKRAEPGIALRRATSAVEVRRALGSLSRENDIVIADGPGGLERQTVALLLQSDLVLIPVMASPLDLRSALTGAAEMVKEVRRSGKANPKARIIINGIDTRTRISADFSSTHFQPPALTSTVRRLSDFVRAAAQYTSVTRMKRRGRNARKDVDALFGELIKLRLVPSSPSTETKRAANV